MHPLVYLLILIPSALTLLLLAARETLKGE
jgi:hypothetical protein